MARRTAAPVLLAAVVILAGCGRPPAMGAARAGVGTIATTLVYTGDVAPRWTVDIASDTPGRVVSVGVKQGQAVHQGDVIAELDKRDLQDAVARAEADVASAQAGLASAQAKLDSVLAGPRVEDVAAARASAAAAQSAVDNLAQGRPEAVAQAEASLAAAKQKLAQSQAGGRDEVVAQAQAKLDGDTATLNKLLAGPVQQDVVNARLAVEAAKDHLFADQTAYDRQVGSGLASKEQRQAVLDADQVAIDQANTALDKLLAPPRPEDVATARAAVEADAQALAVARQPNTQADIAQLEAAVEQAQAGLAQARQPGSAAAIAQAQQLAAAQQAQAAKAAHPYTDQDVEQARAAVDVARAAMQSAAAASQSARTALSNATITAPATGLISSVPAAAGSLAGPGVTLATEISTDLEVASGVAQDQVSQLREGQPASILAGCALTPGQVASVAPAADAQTRTFPVKVQPAAAAAPLRAGMTVTVRIETARVERAVLIPAIAVQSRGGRQVVFEAADGKAKMTDVRTGVSDGTNVQITDGIHEGDVVLLPGGAQLADGQPVTVGEPSTPAGSETAASAPQQPACVGGAG